MKTFHGKSNTFGKHWLPSFVNNALLGATIFVYLFHMVTLAWVWKVWIFATKAICLACKWQAQVSFVSFFLYTTLFASFTPFQFVLTWGIATEKRRGPETDAICPAPPRHFFLALFGCWRPFFHLHRVFCLSFFLTEEMRQLVFELQIFAPHTHKYTAKNENEMNNTATFSRNYASSF